MKFVHVLTTQAFIAEELQKRTFFFGGGNPLAAILGGLYGGKKIETKTEHSEHETKENNHSKEEGYGKEKSQIREEACFPGMACFNYGNCPPGMGCYRLIADCKPGMQCFTFTADCPVGLGCFQTQDRCTPGMQCYDFTANTRHMQQLNAQKTVTTSGGVSVGGDISNNKVINIIIKVNKNNCQGGNTCLQDNNVCIPCQEDIKAQFGITQKCNPGANICINKGRADCPGDMGTNNFNCINHIATLINKESANYNDEQTVQVAAQRRRKNKLRFIELTKQQEQRQKNRLIFEPLEEETQELERMPKSQVKQPAPKPVKIEESVTDTPQQKQIIRKAKQIMKKRTKSNSEIKFLRAVILGLIKKQQSQGGYKPVINTINKIRLESGSNSTNDNQAGVQANAGNKNINFDTVKIVNSGGKAGTNLNRHINDNSDYIKNVGKSTNGNKGVNQNMGKARNTIKGININGVGGKKVEIKGDYKIKGGFKKIKGDYKGKGPKPVRHNAKGSLLIKNRKVYGKKSTNLVAVEEPTSLSYNDEDCDEDYKPKPKSKGYAVLNI